MAETFLVPIIKEALFKLAPFIAREIRFAWGLEKELEKLSKLLNQIQHVLQDAEERQSEVAIRDWLQELKDVAYDMVDVLDEVAYEVLRHRVETQSQVKRVRNFFSPSNPIAFRFNMANKIKKINESLVKLKGDAVFNTLLARNERPRVRKSQPDTHSFLDSKFESRRDEDVTEIVNLLTEQRSHQHPISVISLIGMAGVGKTTLAKLLCQEIEKRKMFDVVAWVCVSDDFDEKIILNGMLEHLGHNAGGINNMNVLLKKLEEKIEKKTFLLVLDDVWEDDSNTWATFSDLLSKFVKTSGNSIVVTTRKEGVTSSIAEYLPLHRHHLKRLSNDDCWLIIKEKVFGSTEASITDQQLEAIGRDIAERCGGLPLIANVLGGTMCNVKGVDGWLSIKDKIVWNLEDFDQIKFVLKLSFDHLPSHLKKCFSYCSIFPKDFIFAKDDLVQHWMAQGFLCSSGQEMMEDIGNKYVCDLISNCLFQDVVWDRSGNIISFKMHDAVHDLALLVSEGEALILKNDSICENSCIRHLRVPSSAVVDPTILRCVAPKLHSLFSEVDFCSMSKMDLKSIRSLSLKKADGDKLPVSPSKLKHLRYLEISKTKIKALPKSFSKLYNLQTLKLMYCSHLQKLPDGMENLISLRHFCFSDDRLMPRNIGRLTSLQTLSLFAVGREKGYHIEELGCLSQLGGALTIRNLQFVKSKSEATKANMEQKTKLYVLHLEWGRNKEEGYNSYEEVLEGLQPPSNLKNLSIRGYMGEKFPSWIEKGVNLSGDAFLLNNLLHLQLFGCGECIDIPSLGFLPNLQFLHIRSMEKVKRMGSKFYLNRSNIASSSHGGGDTITVFPALKILRLDEMGSLEEWVEIEGVIVFPCLEKLLIRSCPKLKTWFMSGFAPSWIEKGVNLSGDAFLLNNLLDLQLFGCGECIDIPSLGFLPNLQFLYVRSMEKVKRMGSKFYLNRSNIASSSHGGGDTITLFPALKNLRLDEMGSLEEWVEIEGVIVFPCLERLFIWRCPKLKTWSMSGFASHHKLSELEISYCSSLVAIPSIDGQLSLKTLSIRDCRELVCLPTGLDTCTSLQYLTIEQCPNLISISQDMGRFHLLTSLTIRDCEKVRSISEEYLSGLNSLKNVEMGPFWSELEEFPGFGVTPIPHRNISIETLSLEGWDKIKSLPHQLQHFTTLRELSISNCNGVEAFPEWLGDLSSLVFLSICSCNKLNRIPEECLGRLTRLKQLTMGPFNPELEEFPGLTSIHHLHASLEYLSLFGWDKLKSLPDQLQHLTALKVLRIDSFTGVEALPEWLGNLSSLTFLIIHSWNKLKSIPEECLGRLTCLETLWMGPFWSELEEYPGLSSIHHLHASLKCLSLSGWDKLKSLPRQLRHLTALQQLTIGGFNGVEALPECLGDLSSLQGLWILACDNLTHLPSVKAMHRLSNLEYLQIGNCSKLKERCAKERGPEWPKISHILDTDIWLKDPTNPKGYRF
ncbi:hypothetical protein SLA2020_070970 [Shorea laevis]